VIRGQSSIRFKVSSRLVLTGNGISSPLPACIIAILFEVLWSLHLLIDIFTGALFIDHLSNLLPSFFDTFLLIFLYLRFQIALLAISKGGNVRGHF
jgi:hypothetical protein